MPFKSEAQRKYLWANEPEIARDWTDEYGSGIQAAHGGRIGSVGGISRPKYQQGNMVGAEIEGAEMEGAMMESEEVIKELYDALIAQGLSPQEAIEKIKQIIASAQTEGPQSPMMAEEFPGQEFGRTPAAFGGIMDTYTGRRKYGLGSFIKKAFKKVKKLASSKVGKLALAAVAAYYAPAMATRLGGSTMPAQSFMGQLARGNRLSALKTLLPGGVTPGGEQSTLFNFLKPANKVVSDWGPEYGRALKPSGNLDVFGRVMSEGEKLAALPEGLKKLALDAGTVSDKFKFPGGALTAIGLPSIGAGLYTAKMPVEELEDTTSEYDTQKSAFDRYLAGLGSYEGGDYRVPVGLRAAQGGRIGRQEGGLMDLGGMEKDYRNDGGFVPIGGQEKADDVPARLSRNEFVFTADAVRNAGGGDIDRGAEVMENVMKNLEGGGKISEESQGQGAQEMFEVSERLSEVV